MSDETKNAPDPAAAELSEQDLDQVAGGTTTAKGIEACPKCGQLHCVCGKTM